MIEWYAYKHNNGTIHLRRYFGDPLDIQEAIESPFVDSVTDVFLSCDREEALKLAEVLL